MSKLYKSYMFRAKDPAIDELRTVVEDHFGHRVTPKDARQIEEDGGPRAGTIGNWFSAQRCARSRQRWRPPVGLWVTADNGFE